MTNTLAKEILAYIDDVYCNQDPALRHEKLIAVCGRFQDSTIKQISSTMLEIDLKWADWPNEELGEKMTQRAAFRSSPNGRLPAHCTMIEAGRRLKDIVYRVERQNFLQPSPKSSPCTIYIGSRAVPTACEVLSRLDWPVSRTRPATLPARIIDYNVMIKYRLPRRQPVRPWVPPGTVINLVGHVFGVRRRENRGASGYECSYVAHKPGRTDSMACGSTTSGLGTRSRYWMAAYRPTSSPRDAGTTRQPYSAGTPSEAKSRTTGPRIIGGILGDVPR